MAKAAEIRRSMMIGGIVLALFAIITTALVAYTYEETKTQIAENERLRLLKSLNELVPSTQYDNAIFWDYIDIDAPGLNRKGSTIRVYRARMVGEPVAVIMQVVAMDGYAGPIKMLVGIHHTGQLEGVRVISHRETPGLGDAIELERSDWILGFSGKSLENTAEKRWRVIKDGGVFDQFAGATITPRAIVNTVRKSLLYFKEHKSLLFNKRSAPFGGVEK